MLTYRVSYSTPGQHYNWHACKNSFSVSHILGSHFCSLSNLPLEGTLEDFQIDVGLVTPLTNQVTDFHRQPIRGQAWHYFLNPTLFESTSGIDQLSINGGPLAGSVTDNQTLFSR